MILLVTMMHVRFLRRELIINYIEQTVDKIVMLNFKLNYYEKIVFQVHFIYVITILVYYKKKNKNHIRKIVITIPSKFFFSKINFLIVSSNKYP